MFALAGKTSISFYQRRLSLVRDKWEKTKSNSNANPPLVVLASSTACVVGGWFANKELRNRLVGNDDFSNSDFPGIARAVRSLRGEYLSMVADSEVEDSIERLIQLSKIDVDKRSTLFQRQREEALRYQQTPTKKKLLLRHLECQQRLVELLTCESSGDSDACSELVGRRLSASERLEVQAIAADEVQFSKQ